MPNLLSSINHIVVLMLENRSFDHMLGFLYAAEHNIPPNGAAFEGLRGNESNPDGIGAAVPVFRIRPTDQKHPVLLPVGESVEFRIHKDKLYLRDPERDKKEREYIVLSMQPRPDAKDPSGKD